MGACTINVEELCLVTEFCANGSLDQYLSNHKKIPKSMKLKWIKGNTHYKLWSLPLITFYIELAAGLYHLSQVGFVHRDLAARNVLLDENYRVKVKDIGKYPDWNFL